jgi:hypothetical protein
VIPVYLARDKQKAAPKAEVVDGARHIGFAARRGFRWRMAARIAATPTFEFALESVRDRPRRRRKPPETGPIYGRMSSDFSLQLAPTRGPPCAR